jgi:hypothetical protein
MMQKALILAFLLAAFPSIGFAQDDARMRGDKACRSDANRLCRKVLKQGDMVVLQCLQTNAKKISPACRKVLQEQGQL